MDQDYDVVVCGTGFQECILSGLLSVNGSKVLHVDRNNYYGGESASLNLSNLFKKFEGNSSISSVDAGSGDKLCDGGDKLCDRNNETAPVSWGSNRDWNVDLIPKFIMADGKLVKILIKTRVKDYLEFQVIDGCYVYQHQKGGWLSSEKFIHKVPATESEAFGSALIPMAEKLRGKQFFSFISTWNKDDEKSWQGLHPTKCTMSDVYKHFGVSETTKEFVGHSIALHTSDDYLLKPMQDTMSKIKLYLSSLFRYGYSPFIYPMYGLGTLPEGFSRLSAVYGGIYMLNTELEKILLGPEGQVIGAILSLNQHQESTSQGGNASQGGNVKQGERFMVKCKKIICDPSYCLAIRPENVIVIDNDHTNITLEEIDKMTPSPIANKFAMNIRNKVVCKDKIIRVINILNQPIPNTNNKKSCQIILPQKQLLRGTDIYIAMISATHGICKQGKYIALVSANIETNNPTKELEPAFKILGSIEKQFTNISNRYVATDDGSNDHIYVTDSYDATSHFETATENVLKIWKNMMGEELDLTIVPSEQQED
ncbi:Rab-GDP dissociation inhibitor [Gregarina niphandrodes]|uniref:Rab-GDP dissociation inhibitor n=1 Tax=Gregarina niphandrodes TaxID=110365 RepID=A0A023B476_GRENI|nr:Rab-GDP dissociation inhibitor [Gregarina niphandrodes]EZG56361.1 Rab-GDP dissociation inhibitor [Gregarina niphandrodes]|eukprot:XP_011131290.1 Rab-GDP dissociation inhibitor [Gregarina niphandrodes]